MSVWLWWLATGFVGVQLLTLLSNLATFPVLEAAQEDDEEDSQEVYAGPSSVPKVSILIPARNEEDNLPVTLPRILAQPNLYEVLVLRRRLARPHRRGVGAFRGATP